MAYTNDQKMAFVMQRAQGKSFDKIAQELGVSKQTLITWQSELNNQIKEQIFYELQTITEAYAVTRKQRFDANAKLLGAVLAEMTRRADADQLAEIPTDKLVNLAMVLERRISQDTGRELVSIRVDSTQKLFRSMDGEYIDAD
jgi:transposase-like protein